MEKKIIFLTSLCLGILVLAQTSFAATENLDEMMARKVRYATNPWPKSQLEDASNNYIWQSETLSYKDVTTGHEVWVLVHGPDNQDFYSKEHGTNAWSFNGSRIGFFDYSIRKTNNPTIRTDRGSMRWVVNADGSKLKASEGYGKHDCGLNGFGWANTENSYYAFGSDERPIIMDGPVYNLYKMTLDNSNVVTGTLVLNTSSINTLKKDLVKDGISSNDSRAVFRDFSYRSLNTPNPINTAAVYFANIKGTPSITSWWGVARHIGPSTNNWADPYSNHLSSSEERFHDVWSPGPNANYIVGDYSGISSLFVYFKDHGSYLDGGPQWEDWDGDSFGLNEEIKVISNGAGGTNNPYNTQYFGHPAFDRWGRYAVIGTYEDCGNSFDGICPGTRIYDMQTNSFFPNRVLATTYDGQHHSWTGWTDYVVGVDPVSHDIHINKWTDSYQNKIAVVNTHFGDLPYSGNYNAYPRPSQSPDGTKVAIAQYFLNGSQLYPYISYAVAYNPYPPTNLSASYSGGVKLNWLPPTYTTRGWPNEATDPAPYAREIKKYHIWRSNNGTSGWQEINSVNATYHVDDYYGLVHDTGNLNITDNPGNGTFYYAVTSQEHSGLESDELSEILRVTVSGTSVTTQVVAPKGQKNFWRTAPPQPGNFASVAQSTAGQYRLTWNEPSDTKVRYYNIYYSNLSNPTAIQQQRIASVPVDTNKYLDWLADQASAGYYGITSVDRYGNESNIVYPGASDTTPPSVPSGLSVQ